jgi:hypothetical protein
MRPVLIACLVTSLCATANAEPPTSTQSAEPPAAEEADATYARPVDTMLYGGLATSGVGAALLVVAGMSVSRVRQLQDDEGFAAYRAGLTPDKDACAQAESGVVIEGAMAPADVVSLCDEASAWEITGYATAPTGLVLLGVGLYLILTSDTVQEEASIQVTPAVAADGGSVLVSGRF